MPAQSQPSPPPWERGPVHTRLIRFLGIHCLVGVAAGLLFAIAFLLLDVAGLRSILTATREAGLAIFMFCFALAILFGSLAMGVGVMTLPRDRAYGEVRRDAGQGEDGPER
jgi:hypothetical protein